MKRKGNGFVKQNVEPKKKTLESNKQRIITQQKKSSSKGLGYPIPNFIHRYSTIPNLFGVEEQWKTRRYGCEKPRVYIQWLTLYVKGRWWLSICARNMPQHRHLFPPAVTQSVPIMLQFLHSNRVTPYPRSIYLKPLGSNTLCQELLIQSEQMRTIFRVQKN